ncbi:MAG: hypothetical protein H0W62_11940 [Chitinophagales bacterium]|nr:hypothetical protein [Chitinophagales bacterium]
MVVKEVYRGVQHIAYSTSITNLDKIISDFGSEGFSIIRRFDTPIAKIVFFNTRKKIGFYGNNGH